MHKHLILAAHFSLVTLPAFAGATMPTIINGGTTPVTGTCPGGQFIYNNNGVAACETATAAMYVTVDATQFSGSDMCAKIAAAANALISRNPNSGTIDATGFSGTQTCAASPFGSWPGGGEFSTTIKFGRVTWVTNNQIVIPSRTHIVGASPYSFLATGEGFIIRMGDSFSPPTGAPVALVVFGGTSTTSQSNTNNYFNVQLRNADVHCDEPTSGMSPANSIGVLNTNSQEESFAQNVNIHGCYVGLQVGTSYAQNSGPYTNIGIGFAGTSGAGTKCLLAGDPNTNSVLNVTFRGISCGGGGTANSTYAISLSGYALRLVDSHVEEAVNGVSIGRDNYGADIQVVNFTCTSNMSGDCVQIANDGGDTIYLQNIYAGSGSGSVNTINDTQSYGGAISASDEPRVSMYSRGGYSNAFEGGNYNHVLTDAWGIPSTIGHHLTFASVAPSIASGSSDCGTSPSIVGNDTAGRITVGSGTNGGKCTLTFAKTWPNAPICTATDETTGVLVIPKGPARSSVAFTGSIVAGDTLAYHCFGYM